MFIFSSSFLMSIISSKVLAPVVLPYFFILRCRTFYMFFLPNWAGLTLVGTEST